ncbi:MAG: hypothetical protein AAF823_10930 [Planctomycetota bacterium]
MGSEDQAKLGFRVCVILIAAGFLGASYFGWAYWRMSNHALMDDNWPQPFPSPDAWLYPLHDWYDRMNPVGPGFIKMNGEVARVRITVEIAIACSVLPAIVGGLALVRVSRPKPAGHCVACGYDLRGNLEATACPECGEEVMAVEPASRWPVRKIIRWWRSPPVVAWNDARVATAILAACLVSFWVVPIVATQLQGPDFGLRSLRFPLLAISNPLYLPCFMINLGLLIAVIVATGAEKRTTMAWCVGFCVLGGVVFALWLIR